MEERYLLFRRGTNFVNCPTWMYSTVRLWWDSYINMKNICNSVFLKSSSGFKFAICRNLSAFGYLWKKPRPSPQTHCINFWKNPAHTSIFELKLPEGCFAFRCRNFFSNYSSTTSTQLFNVRIREKFLPGHEVRTCANRASTYLRLSSQLSSYFWKNVPIMTSIS